MTDRTPLIKLIGSRTVPVWSGNNLSHLYEKFKKSGKIGESWETSVVDGAEAIAEIDGKCIPFGEYLRLNILPTPPLVKLIDAGTPLSIQVHPDEITAKLLGGVAKSEIWYILSAIPEASVLYGTKPGITLEEVRSAIISGDIEPLMNRVPVKAGDVFMIPPGMLHSLGGGITVLEVQDRPGTTYRVKDISGNREIHRQESAESVRIYSTDDAAALATVDFSRLKDYRGDGKVIAATGGYAVIRYDSVKSRDQIAPPSNDVYMFCEKGGGSSCGTVFNAGDSLYFADCKIPIELDSQTSVFFVL